MYILLIRNMKNVALKLKTARVKRWSSTGSITQSNYWSTLGLTLSKYWYISLLDNFVNFMSNIVTIFIILLFFLIQTYCVFLYFPYFLYIKLIPYKT